MICAALFSPGTPAWLRVALEAATLLVAARFSGHSRSTQRPGPEDPTGFDGEDVARLHGEVVLVLRVQLTVCKATPIIMRE